jgi:phospholipid transport system substrate-binding protein
VVAQPQASKESALSPHDLVNTTTEKLMGVVKAKQATYEKNPGKYFSEVESLLEPVVDFDFIARSVMGAYWKTATAEQQGAFIKVFKKGLVETYAKGMAKFNDLKVEVLPPEAVNPEFGKVTVMQKVAAADGVNKVAYTMGRRKTDASWKLLNVVLDGVNLGKTFRSQFAQSVKEHDGNLDAAIAGWAS